MSSSDESSPRRSISDYLGHLGPLISRGAGSPPLALLPSPSPSPPAPPLRSSQSSPAIIMTSPNTPCSSKRVRATITKASFAALVRSAIPPPVESVPFTPPQHQPPKIPRTASLGMLKNVVTKAVKRRERASSETEAATDDESVAESHESNESTKKPNVPRRTSSSKATPRESDLRSKREEGRGRGQSTESAKRNSQQSSPMFWEAL